VQGKSVRIATLLRNVDYVEQVDEQLPAVAKEKLKAVYKTTSKALLEFKEDVKLCLGVEERVDDGPLAFASQYIKEPYVARGVHTTEVNGVTVNMRVGNAAASNSAQYTELTRDKPLPPTCATNSQMGHNTGMGLIAMQGIKRGDPASAYVGEAKDKDYVKQKMAPQGIDGYVLTFKHSGHYCVDADTKYCSTLTQAMHAAWGGLANTAPWFLFLFGKEHHGSGRDIRANVEYHILNNLDFPMARNSITNVCGFLFALINIPEGAELKGKYCPRLRALRHAVSQAWIEYDHVRELCREEDIHVSLAHAHIDISNVCVCVCAP
jgi:hypothetical protein